MGFFFFSSRRRHTRFDCDWSSDVCSSDLVFELDPPTVLIRQPVQGAHLRAAQSVQVAATDLLSGVRTVELQVNGGNWQATRSEERRVGKECRSRWSPYH